MQAAVEMLNISKFFPGVTANENVSITVDEGQILGLIGENGAGKSTMMNILYGLLQPDEGVIKLFGKEVKIQSPEMAISLGIGMVHQHFMLMDNLSVLQNIILGSVPQKHGLIDEKAAKEKIEGIMTAYNLQVDLDEKVYRLSVGEKQRVEIVKALYRNARIIIMDEPTAVLTPHETDKLMEVLKKLKEQGSSIIFITHKLREVLEITDKITVMRKGIVTGNLDTKNADASMLSNLMVGRQVNLNIDRKEYNPEDVILEVDGLTVRDQRGLLAVRDVTFNVRAGEIVGIAGVEGNGQTELIEAITGLSGIVSGKILLNGEEISKSSIRIRREKGMGHIPEDRLKVGTAKICTIRDNLIMNRYYQKPYTSFGIMDNKKLLQLSEEMCTDFQIKTPDSSYLLSTLSGGNMQKVVFAREIEADPKLLVAAQPTRGVDIGAIEAIHHKIIEVRDSGKAVLLVSAELEEILSLSDRILVIFEGQIMAELLRGDADEKTIGLYMTGAKRQRGKQDE